MSPRNPAPQPDLRISIEAATCVVTLETFREKQIGIQGAYACSIRTLQRYCREGTLPGAVQYKNRGKWFVNLAILLVASGMQPSLPTTEGQRSPRSVAKDKSILGGPPPKPKKKKKLGDGFDGYDIATSSRFRKPTSAQTQNGAKGNKGEITR